MAQLQQLQISINGVINPSLIRMINQAQAQLIALGATVKTQNAAMSAIYKQAFAGGSQAVKKTEELNAAMKRVHEIATGVFSGEVLFQGLEKATELVERMGDAMKEFAKSSLEVRATREVLQNQQKAMLESQGKAGMGPEIDTLIRNMEGRETMIRYDQLMETTNLLMASAPQRFQSVDDVHKMLGQLSDISKNPATFDLASQAFTRILAEGKVDQRHLNEMSIDTGFAFKTAMANALKVSPEELTEMIAKHKLSGSASIDALMKAFDIITGPGGAAYKHAEAQLKGLSGIWARFLGHWADFEESFGKQLENFISPIAEKVFALLTPAELTHAFDQFEDMSVEFGQSIANLIAGIASYMEVVGGPDMLRHLEGVGYMFKQMFKDMTGGFDPDTMFSDAEIPGMGGPGGQYSGGNYRVLNATGDAWVKQFTVGIDAALDKIREFGSRVDNLMLHLEPIFKLIGLVQSLFSLIDDFLFGKLLPFFLDKLMEALNRLQNKLHEMFPWMVPAAGSANAGQNALYQNYRDTGVVTGEEYLQKLEANTEALQSLTDGWTGSSGVGSYGLNYGIHGGMTGAGAGYSPTNWGNVSAYDDAFREASAKSGIPFNTLKAIALQEGVDPRDNNPMGITSGANGLNADHFSKEEAKARIVRQAMLPYMRGFRPDATPEERARAFRIYTPPGAANDRGQNQFKQSETEEIIKKLDAQKPVTMNFHIHAIDSDSFAQTIHKHAEVIADHVHRVIQSDWERTASV